MAHYLPVLFAVVRLIVDGRGFASYVADDLRLEEDRSMAVDFGRGLRVGQCHQVLAFFDGLGIDGEHESLRPASEECSVVWVGLRGLQRTIRGCFEVT